MTCLCAFELGAFFRTDDDADEDAADAFVEKDEDGGWGEKRTALS